MNPYDGDYFLPEDQREAQDQWEESWEREKPVGEMDPFEGWPEETCGPEYWFHKGLMEGGDDGEAPRRRRRRRG